jgi:predicted Zn-dependent protease
MVVLWKFDEAHMQTINMKKALLQGLTLVLLFFGSWFLLSQVDWLDLLQVKKVSSKTEERLGKMFYSVFRKSDREVRDPLVVHAMDSIINQICTSNNIERSVLKVHVLDNEQVNAFALPDGHLVIYTGLINNVASEEELVGVVCHEIAHIKLNHVMDKLTKEIGLSVLLSMTTGNTSSDVIGKAAKVLSSSAFDRELERAADLEGVRYMIKANVDPEPFANFLSKLGNDKGDMPEYLTWLSTHPQSRERAEYVKKFGNRKVTKGRRILSTQTWEGLRQSSKKE